MRFDYLSTPLSDGGPTGPDLDEEGDNKYFNYVLPAGDRLPSSSYFDARTNEPFDRRSVDAYEESKMIGALLERTRDIRLLTLEARFQANAGTLSDFVDCLDGTALLLEQYWEDAHPRPSGDAFLRRNTLAGLDGVVQYLMPLQFMPLTESNRYVSVSYRRYLLASGGAQPRGDEEVVSLAQMRDALAHKDNHDTLLAAHEDIQRGLAAIKRIDAAFSEHTDETVGLTAMPRLLLQIDEMICSHVAGLAPAAAPAESGKEGAAAKPASGGSRTAAVTHDANSPIQSRADASHALACIEAYYLSTEPAALALVLVHQARMLEGRPLIEAIEALVPNRSSQVVVKLDGGMDFQLDVSRIRAVSTDAFDQLASPEEEAAPNPAISVDSRDQAADLMARIEAYYRVTEPASPIPLLLSRARSSISGDFLSILNELLPKDSSH